MHVSSSNHAVWMLRREGVCPGPHVSEPLPIWKAGPRQGDALLHFQTEGGRGPECSQPTPGPRAPPALARELGAQRGEALVSYVFTLSSVHSLARCLSSSLLQLGWGRGQRNKSDKTLLPSYCQALEKRNQRCVIPFTHLLKIYFLSSYCGSQTVLGESVTF